MALVPKINITINNICDKINVYEETSPYVLATNATGWGTPNVNTSNITAADLKIYDYTGVTLLNTVVMYDGSTDVYVGVSGAPSPGRFLAVKDHLWTEADGVFKLVYALTASAVDYTNVEQYVLFNCNLENCIDGLKDNIITECDSKTLSKLKGNLDQLEILLYGIQSAFASADFVTATLIIANAKIVCDNLCDCGCGDC